MTDFKMLPFLLFSNICVNEEQEMSQRYKKSPVPNPLIIARNPFLSVSTASESEQRESGNEVRMLEVSCVLVLLLPTDQ